MVKLQMSIEHETISITNIYINIYYIFNMIVEAEDAAVPRGDTEDAEVYRKPGDEDSICQLMDPEKVSQDSFSLNTV